MNGFERMYRRVVDYTQAGQWSEVYDGPIEGFDVEQLKAENAKLRELVRALWYCTENENKAICEGCPLGTVEGDRLALACEKLMYELGVDA